MPTPVAPKEASKTLCVGHRGASAYAPENTLASFRMALDMGVDLVECDIHMSRDGHLVVFHDDTLERTSNGTGPVHALSLAELKGLDAGSWFSPEFAGERIPRLEEVLELVRGRARILVEIKYDPGFNDGIERKLVEALRAHGMREDAVVISFDHAALRRVHEVDSGVATGPLFVANILDVAGFVRPSASSWVGPLWQLASPELIRDAHDHGIGVCPWTVNEPKAMRRMIALGVEAVTTNHPDLLLGELGRPCQGR